jgi:AcrR family transcriptional regulator
MAAADEIAARDGRPGGTVHTSKGDRTRTSILRAALRVFSHRGYRSGSLASIADEVGVTQQGVLHYFGSKEALLVEVLKRRDEAERRGRRRSADGESLFARTVDLVRRNEEQPEEVRFFSVLVGEALTDDYPATDYVRSRYADLVKFSARVLERGQESGQIRQDVDVEDVAALLLAAMDGLQIQWLLHPDRGMVRPFELLAELLEDDVAVR